MDADVPQRAALGGLSSRRIAPVGWAAVVALKTGKTAHYRD